MFAPTSKLFYAKLPLTKDSFIFIHQQIRGRMFSFSCHFNCFSINNKKLHFCICNEKRIEKLLEHYEQGLQSLLYCLSLAQNGCSYQIDDVPAHRTNRLLKMKNLKLCFQPLKHIL